MEGKGRRGCVLIGSSLVQLSPETLKLLTPKELEVQQHEEDWEAL